MNKIQKYLWECELEFSVFIRLRDFLLFYNVDILERQTVLDEIVCSCSEKTSNHIR